MAVEREAFKVELKGFAEVGAHFFEGVAGAGAAGNVGREAAHVGGAAFVDDKVSSRHGFNPACLRIL